MEPGLRNGMGPKDTEVDKVVHGFKAVDCNGVTYELSCKCGQVWVARNKAMLLECFDAHMNIYEVK